MVDVDMHVIDILTPFTLPDNLFEHHDTQKAAESRPQIAGTRPRQQNKIGEEVDETEEKLKNMLPLYDSDSLRSVDRDRDYTPDEYESLLVQLEDKYIHPFKALTGDKLRQYILTLFDLNDFPDRPYELRDIQAGYKINLFQIYKIYLLFLKYNMVGKQDAKSTYNMNTFNRLLHVLYQMNQIIMSEYYLQAAIEGTSMVGDELNLFRFTPQDYSNNGPFQNLLIFVLNTAYSKGYRLYRKGCYSQIYHNTYPTHAWKYECTVEAFIYQCIDKETNFAMWQNLTQSKDNAKRAADYLMAAHDKEFPTLEPKRFIWSFTDGVYNGEERRFYKYDEEPLPSNVVAIKFFPMPFQPDHVYQYKYWQDIPTPELDNVFRYQNLSPEVCDIIYMMMGRCLYDVNQLDHWEVIMFIKGVAGSGKSTIGKLLKYLYPSDDVAILSSNIEKKFGLDAVYDKLLYLCLEVKQNFGLDQGDFQSMISGEEMSIAIKHKKAITTVWTVPGMLMGNEVAAGWVDAAGSMARRIVLVDFSKRVKSSDTTLMTKLRRCIPAILHKINSAYHSAVYHVGSSSLWEMIPAYFHEQQKKFKAAINPLQDFLESHGNGEMELEAEGFIPYSEFKTAYMRFLRMGGYQNIRFNEDHYRSIFEEYGLNVTQYEERFYQGNMKSCQWITGISPKPDNTTAADH